MKKAATKSYGKKGEQVVAMNHNAIDSGKMCIRDRVQPLPEKRSICIFRAAVTRFLMLSELSPPLY